MGHPAFYVVLTYTAGAVLLGWSYFRHYQLTRPPIGVLTLGDVAIMIGAIILVPYLYLALPLWLVTGLFVAGILSILYFTTEPVLRSRRLIWLVVVTLLVADIAAELLFGSSSVPFHAVNDTVLTLVIVGATNLWAQSGMRARDAAILAGALAIYDLFATSLLPLTTELFNRMAGLPLTPVVAWGAGSGWLGIGLGDLLLATVFPLVMRKAFGRRAGIAAMAIGVGAIAAMMILLQLFSIHVALPVMTALGPLMVLQYVYWTRQKGTERTTWEYLQAEPMGFHQV